MIFDEDGRRDYGKKLDVISMIPSSKIDEPNLNRITDDKMEEFEKRHLQELAEQTRNYDVNEQQVVAENIDPFILYNVLGQWMTEARKALERGASIFQVSSSSQGGSDGNL